MIPHLFGFYPKGVGHNIDNMKNVEWKKDPRANDFCI